MPADLRNWVRLDLGTGADVARGQFAAGSEIWLGDDADIDRIDWMAGVRLNEVKPSCSPMDVAWMQ